MPHFLEGSPDDQLVLAQDLCDLQGAGGFLDFRWLWSSRPGLLCPQHQDVEIVSAFKHCSFGEILVSFKSTIRHLERHVEVRCLLAGKTPQENGECLTPQLLQIEGALLSSTLELCSGTRGLHGG